MIAPLPEESHKWREMSENQLSCEIAELFKVAGYQPRSHQLQTVIGLTEALLFNCHPLGLQKRSKVSWNSSDHIRLSNLDCDINPFNFLLQHSVGSGKSLTIAALAFVLTGLTVINSFSFFSFSYFTRI